ncbi:trehalose-phosphatase [uncultured Bifidobacterium sp.]|nr:trehalose-phosphatase [uncultured Bifidobacterium sp.]
MSRLIIVSNRLPVSLDGDGAKGFSLRQNVGGLATAIGPYHKAHRDCLWVGWSGVDLDDYDADQVQAIRDAYAQRRCIPLFLTPEEVSGYYAGFSNDTLWPLFHDFSHEAIFDPSTWETYQRVNQLFAKALEPLIHDGDVVWIQDYHLMLLPQMLRDRFPKLPIGWFLHVPFPSPEIYRSLPWSREILEGVLGADLVGFHTVDYARNFVSSVQLLLDISCDDEGHVPMPGGRSATVDAFPIGIDYELYKRTSRSNLAKAMRMGIEEVSGKKPGRRYATSLTAESNAVAEAITKEGTWWSHYAHEELPELTLARSAVAENKPNKVVVSVDRLDYTKGLPERLKAFGRLLEKYPEWTGHVTYYLLATPSRENVDTYRHLKEQVDQLVGQINGRYSLLSWTPIHYITRSLPIKPVCGIYAAGDVALVTPLRDGMNLVAKEYLACHDGRDGALVLSDMCGAANELTEAFIVNPYDTEALCEALHSALEISPEESKRRNIAMQSRIRVRTAAQWSADFLDALAQVTSVGLSDRRLRMSQCNELLAQWDKAERKLVLCDYDGTLTPLVRSPERARPTRGLLGLLRRLGGEPGVDLAIVSGRDRSTMDEWFHGLPVGLIAEHGAWSSDPADDSLPRKWRRSAQLPDSGGWMPIIRSAMLRAVERVPRSFIETKSDALAWHYRQSDQRLAAKVKVDLLSELRQRCGGLGLMTMENSKVVEVCPVSVSKGNAVSPRIMQGDYGVVIIVGDDTTDETMFAVAPDDAWTIKIGEGQTNARYRLTGPAALRRLLSCLTAESQASRIMDGDGIDGKPAAA